MKRLLLMVLALTLAATAHAQQQLTISTGPTAGVWYPMGGAMANVLSKTLPNTAATAEVTGGSVDNLKLIASGKTDLGFSMVDAAFEAMEGKGKFKEKVPMRTLAVVHALIMHVVTIEGTGIQKISDLKGRRVSTGPPGSGTEVMAGRLLEAYGIDPLKDIRRERLSVNEAVNAIKDRKIDAFLHAAGIPLPAVTDLSATPGITAKLLDAADAVDAMNKKYGPIYAKSKIPAKTYRGQDRDSAVATVWGVLYVNEKMSEKTAYDVMKTLFEKRDELIRAHREAENMTLENQTIGASPTPYHPGALRYLKEKGVTPK